MASNTFPSDWADQPCFLVAIPRPLVQYVGGLMRVLEQRGFWLDETDYQRGYSAVMQFERCLMATCLNDLMALQEAQYRMLNTALFGQVYTSDESEPPVVSPAIAPFVGVDIIGQASVNGRLEALLQLTDNSINGTETPLYTYSPSVKELIQGVIDAITSEGTDLGSILTELETIAVLVG